MEFNSLLLEVADGVAKVTMNRPDSFNVLNLEMARELSEVSIICGEDPGIRAVVLTGSGKAFSGGGDINEFSSVGEDLPAHTKRMTIYFHGAVSRFAWMDAPLITAVNGAAGGGGMSIAIMGDLVFAARSAKFTLAYTRIGLTPDGSSTYYLPRIIGVRRTMELALTNRTLSAHEALDWGIVNRVVDDEACVDAAMALAKELAAGPTGAYGGVKNLLASSFGDSLEGQMEREARHIARRAGGADVPEGIRSFLEKRPAKFIGN